MVGIPADRVAYEQTGPVRAGTMRSYSEWQGFYPDGYTTTKGRPVTVKQLFLSERCCVTTEGKWFVKTQAGTWDYITSSKVVPNAMRQSWIGGKLNITADDIAKFISGDPPIVHGAMPVPTSTAPCIEFQSQRYINTWRKTFLPACPDALTDPALRPTLTLLMRMIREGLCGRPDELSLDDMLKAATSDHADELQYRFFWNFLAAPLQSPGLNLQVNTWLLGHIGGIGKGLLTARIMPRLYGPHNVALLDPSEIEQGGWTDAIEGKLVVVVNELEARGNWAGFWNSSIKRNSCDATVPIRKRGTHGHEALNFANWIITSNHENPRCLDSDDRRNALIATTTDEAKKALASELYQRMNDLDDHEMDRMLGGLMHHLLTHKVDHGLLAKAPDTLLKRDALEAGSGDGDGLYWLRNSDSYTRDEWLTASDYLGDYIRFTADAEQLGTRAFGGILSGLARHGHVEKEQPYQTHAASYLISSEKFPTYSKSVRGPTASAKPPFTVVSGGKVKDGVPRYRKE
jgi:hypothetical protein